MATYARKDENVDSLLRRFKKEIMKSGITSELRNREYFLTRTQKKKLKIERNKRKRMKKN